MTSLLKAGRESKGGEVKGRIVRQDLGKEIYRFSAGCANAYDTGYTAEFGSVCCLAHLLLFTLVSFYYYKTQAGAFTASTTN